MSDESQGQLGQLALSTSLRTSQTAFSSGS